MKAAQAAEADTFEAIARGWFAKYQPTWAASHADKIITRLEKDAFPGWAIAPSAKSTPRKSLPRYAA